MLDCVSMKLLVHSIFIEHDFIVEHYTSLHHWAFQLVRQTLQYLAFDSIIKYEVCGSIDQLHGVLNFLHEDLLEVVGSTDQCISPFLMREFASCSSVTIELSVPLVILYLKSCIFFLIHHDSSAIPENILYLHSMYEYAMWEI